jgi:hypothetical protein
VGYHEGNDVRLYRRTLMKGKSPKLQSPWKGTYRVAMQINDVVYRIQQNPRSRIMLIHPDCLAPCHGTAWDEQS